MQLLRKRVCGLWGGHDGQSHVPSFPDLDTLWPHGFHNVLGYARTKKSTAFVLLSQLAAQGTPLFAMTLRSE